jgi:hypothetical protein
MEHIKVFLLDSNAEVQYGLNWGQRDGREPNQAYLQLEPQVYKSDFFPTPGHYFIIKTFDEKTIIFNRAQKKIGTALQTPENNSIIGLYLRKHLGIKPGEEIKLDDIFSYGKLDIDIYKSEEDLTYYLYFSKDWKSLDIRYIYNQYMLVSKTCDDWKEVKKHTSNIDKTSEYISKCINSNINLFQESSLKGLDKIINDYNLLEQELLDGTPINSVLTEYFDFLKSDYYYSHFGSDFFSKRNNSTMNINNTKTDMDYRQYITAIKSKPFLLLAGISGTGKSRIVRELARSCWEPDSEEYNSQKPSNFEMVQVKPNWHDSSELIGYVSRIDGEFFIAGDFLKFIAKAWENPNVPFFLCLDEMNLAPVEQYFAEYLSVIESRKADKNGVVTTDPILKKDRGDWYRILTSDLTDDDSLRTQFLEEGITIPQNLIVVGTVNMDETTFSFSRKVLDRAMTIEMNKVDLMGGLESKFEPIGKLSTQDLIGTAVEGVDVYEGNRANCEVVIKYLQAVNDKLEGTPFKVAYRTRNEFLLYVVNNLPYNKDDEGKEIGSELVIARALDEITSMKVLSRIEGDESKVTKGFLEGLEQIIKEQLKAVATEYNFIAEAVQEENKEDEEGKTNIQSISLAKLAEMKKRLVNSGYTSFWA